jgi:hypothetical protein
MKISNDVLKFAEQNSAKDLFEAWGDYVRHYRSENEGKNFSYDKTRSFSEKTEVLHASIQEVIGKASGANTMFSESVWQMNPNYRWATFAVIGAMVDYILPDTVDQTFGQFAEVRNGGYGDSFVFDVTPADLFVVTKVGQGKRHAFGQRQFNGQVALIPEKRMVTVEEDLYRILAGKRNLAEYAMKVTRSFETEIANDIYAAIDGTFSSLPTQFKESSFAQDSFITLNQRVKAWNGGANTAVFGTKLALSKVVPAEGGFRQALGDEYNTTGYLGKYMGIDLFEIPQKAVAGSDTWAMSIDDTRLYVVSSGNNKLVKVCLEGEMVSYADTQYQNATLVQRQTMVKAWVASVVSNAYFGIVDIS